MCCWTTPSIAPHWIAALQQAMADGSLILCETTLAEVVPTLPAADLATFLSEWKLAFVPSSQSSAILAGEMFRTYLERGGKRGRVVPDFMIGAHARTLADRLLARDRGYYRDYFKDLNVWYPSLAS